MFKKSEPRSVSGGAQRATPLSNNHSLLDKPYTAGVTSSDG
jgi:hypothetical protein